MRRVGILLAGMVGGVICALLFTGAVLGLYPLVIGSGADAMSQGILGTILIFFSAPIFAVVGCIIVYKKYW